MLNRIKIPHSFYHPFGRAVIFCALWFGFIMANPFGYRDVTVSYWYFLGLWAIPLVLLLYGFVEYFFHMASKLKQINGFIIFFSTSAFLILLHEMWINIVSFFIKALS